MTIWIQSLCQGRAIGGCVMVGDIEKVEEIKDVLEREKEMAEITGTIILEAVKRVAREEDVVTLDKLFGETLFKLIEMAENKELSNYSTEALLRSAFILGVCDSYRVDDGYISGMVSSFVGVYLNELRKRFEREGV